MNIVQAKAVVPDFSLDAFVLKALIAAGDMPITKPKIKKLQQCIADLDKKNASLRKQLGEAAREVAVREPSAPLIASLLTETPTGEKGCGIG